MVRVAGIDGCRTGWVVATATLDGDAIVALSVACIERLAPVVDELRAGTLAAIGVDMPIGLPDAGRRASDAAARALLGPRRNSLFPTPPRDVLAASDWADALARCRAVNGVGLSKQVFNLLPKMREVAVLAAPEVQPALSEVHPETTFAVLGGGPCIHPKRSPAGVAERVALLAPHVPGVAAWARPGTVRGARSDDVLDACAACWSAARVATGRAQWLGDAEARDARGLRLTIAV